MGIRKPLVSGLTIIRFAGNSHLFSEYLQRLMTSIRMICRNFDMEVVLQDAMEMHLMYAEGKEVGK